MDSPRHKTGPLIVDKDQNVSFQALMALGWPKRIDKRGLSSTGLQTYPAVPGSEAIYSDDPRMIKERHDLAAELNQHAVSIDKNGFASSNGLISDFSALHTVMGYKANPMSYQVADNSCYVEELNLCTEFKSWRHESIFNALHDVQFERIAASSMSIRKIANSGLPHLTTSLVDKQALLSRFFLHFKNSKLASNDISSLLKAGKFVQLFTDHQLIFMQMNGLRVQPEGGTYTSSGFLGKPREVNDFEYAATSGRAGSRFVADKTCFRKGEILEDSVANRLRAVWASPCAPNYYLTSIFTLYREFYLNEYAFTWKHRTKEEILSKVKRRKNVIGGDVKAYDTTIQRYLLDKFINRFEGSMDDSIVLLLRTMLSMPFLQTNTVATETSEPGPCQVMGDAFRPDNFCLSMGLPSGIACNPDIGKYVATGVYLCLLDDYYHDVLEVGVKTILKGEHPEYALLDASDDVLFLFEDDGFANFLTQFSEAQDSGDTSSSYYLKIAPEKGAAFLGNIFLKDEKGELMVSSNIVSLLVNELCNERGVDSRAREFHYLGHFDRLKNHSEAPLFGTVLEAWDRIHHKHFGESVHARATRWLYDKGTPINMASFSEVEREVFYDPQKLQWKFSHNDVRQEMLNAIVTTIEFDVFWPYLKNLITSKGV